MHSSEPQVGRHHSTLTKAPSWSVLLKVETKTVPAITLSLYHKGFGSSENSLSALVGISSGWIPRQTSMSVNSFRSTGTDFEIFMALKIAAGKIHSHNRLYINMNNKCW